jgi:hypothetical protein
MKNINLIHLFLLYVIFIIPTGCKNLYKLEDLPVSHTKTEMRAAFYRNLVTETIHKNLALPLNSETEENWQDAFWALELVGYRTAEIQTALKQAFINFETRSPAFQRALLEVVYTLYPDEFQLEVARVAQETRQPKIFAMAVCYLRRHDSPPAFYSAWRNLHFPDWQNQPILRRLALADSVIPPAPSLRALLAHPFQPGAPVIFSLQRPNRDYPGLLLVKSATGQFLRNEDGSVFHIPQLARSLSNLPGFLTNGNTPQGIHSFSGFLTSESIFIGPTPTLQMTLPFEASVSQFFHGAVEAKNWSTKHYRELLPAAWQDYPPIYEAFFAGAAGRTEIIAHGTTVDPEFYRNASFYPFTPSLGCLTALELWSGVDGKCWVSGQRQLVNRLHRCEIESGFLVVAEIADKSQPVTLSEVLVELLQAEAR